MASSLLRKTGRRVALITEPEHVTLAIGLYDNEDPPKTTWVEPDLEKMLEIQKQNPEVGKMTNCEFRKRYPECFKIIRDDEAATKTINNQKYFAVELTAKDEWHIKTKIDGKIHPLY